MSSRHQKYLRSLQRHRSSGCLRLSELQEATSHPRTEGAVLTRVLECLGPNANELLASSCLALARSARGDWAGSSRLRLPDTDRLGDEAVYTYLAHEEQRRRAEAEQAVYTRVRSPGARADVFGAWHRRPPASGRISATATQGRRWGSTGKRWFSPPRDNERAIFLARTILASHGTWYAPGQASRQPPRSSDSRMKLLVRAAQRYHYPVIPQQRKSYPCRFTSTEMRSNFG